VPAEACHLRAVVAVSLVLLAGAAHAQQFHSDEGLQAWRQAVGSSARSRASARAGSYYRVSQPSEIEDVGPGEPQTAEQGELVPAPQPAPEEGFFDGDSFAEPPEYMLDEDGESLGALMEDDPTPWYARADVTFLSRSRPPRLVFSRVRQTLILSGTPIGFDLPVLSTTQVKFDFEPGTRVTIGRGLYRDILDRQHCVEFTFLGLFNWGVNTSIRGARISNGAIVFGSLLSDINAGGTDIGGRILGGYNGADEHHVRSLSDLNSYELNYRLRRLPGRDRMVAGIGDTWTRQCTPGMQGSLLTGVRYLSINEQMSFSSNGVASDLMGDPIAEFSAAYRVVTHNDLVGWQIGGDMTAQDCTWSLGMSCKAGVFANVSNQTSYVAVNNNFFAASPNNFFKASDVGVAFVGDLGMTATWRPTPRITLRSTYDFMWVNGIALGPQQMQQDLVNPSPARVNHTSYTVFQGVSLGGEYRW
jgi:Putative beta barrel porin-7 (BBP7)